jgi:hypothetical protein
MVRVDATNKNGGHCVITPDARRTISLRALSVHLDFATIPKLLLPLLAAQYRERPASRPRHRPSLFER